MKTANIKYAAYAILNNAIVDAKFFVSRGAKNNWCNKMYRKHGEDVTVEVYNYQAQDITGALLETWHA